MDNVEKKGQIPRNVQSLTTESGRNRKHEQTNYQEWYQISNQKILNQHKSRTRQLHRWLLPNIRASLVTQMVKNHLHCRRPRCNPWVGNIPWRREWLPTRAFLPREFHRQRSLVGYSSWGHKESDTTEWLILSLSQYFMLLYTFQYTSIVIAWSVS